MSSRAKRLKKIVFTVFLLSTKGMVENKALGLLVAFIGKVPMGCLLFLWQIDAGAKQSTCRGFQFTLRLAKQSNLYACAKNQSSSSNKENDKNIFFMCKFK